MSTKYAGRSLTQACAKHTSKSTSTFPNTAKFSAIVVVKNSRVRSSASPSWVSLTMNSLCKLAVNIPMLCVKLAISSHTIP